MADPALADATPRAFRLDRPLTLGILRAVVENPLDALPPEVFAEPLVLSEQGGVQRLYVMDPEAVHDVFVRHSDVLTKGEQNRRVLGPALGEGLLTADGAHWRWQRRAAAPAFQPARINELAPAMVEAARRTRDAWLARRPGQPVRLGHEMMRLTFAIIVDTMFSGAPGVDVAAVERAVTEALEPVGWSLAYTLARVPSWAPYPGRRRAERAVAFLRAQTGRLVTDRRDAPVSRPDLLTLMQEASDPESGRRLTDEELVDNLLTFIAAGHETTALALAWTLHLLALAPEVEARVVAEIEETTGGAEVEAEHLPQLAYTRQVLSEALRLYPPAPLISRQATEAVEVAGTPLKAGAFVIAPIYALHRQARLWPEPERFDPDRFALEAVAARHKLAWLPFGAGPRVCIGAGFAMLEGVAVLATLLQRVRVSVSEGPSPRAVMRITLRPQPDPVATVGAR